MKNSYFILILLSCFFSLQAMEESRWWADQILNRALTFAQEEECSYVLGMEKNTFNTFDSSFHPLDSDYKKLRACFHPDRHLEDKEKWTEAFKLIDLASKYLTIGKPELSIEDVEKFRDLLEFLSSRVSKEVGREILEALKNEISFTGTIEKATSGSKLLPIEALDSIRFLEKFYHGLLIDQINNYIKQGKGNMVLAAAISRVDPEFVKLALLSGARNDAAAEILKGKSIFTIGDSAQKERYKLVEQYLHEYKLVEQYLHEYGLL